MSFSSLSAVVNGLRLRWEQAKTVIFRLYTLYLAPFAVDALGPEVQKFFRHLLY